jgi:FkbM family methyltransferase
LAAIRTAAYLIGLLPNRVGQFRVAQWYWWRRRPPHQVVSQRMVDGTRVELDLGDRTQALAFMTRRYSEELIREIVERLPADGLFFDVGANAGLVTFQVAHRRPDARIVAFEPNPAAVDAWRRNSRLNGRGRVSLEATAVSNKDGKANFDAPSSDLGAGFIAPPGRGFEVPVVALDSYCDAHGIARIDVMKVDVQGHEPEVLRGARGLLSSGAIRFMILEFDEQTFAACGSSRNDMLRIVADYGMRPAGPVDAEDVGFSPAAAGPFGYLVGKNS